MIKVIVSILIFFSAIFISYVHYDAVGPAYEEVMISGVIEPTWVVDIYEEDGKIVEVFNDPSQGYSRTWTKAIGGIKLMKREFAPTFIIKAGEKVFPICVFPYVGPVSAYLQRLGFATLGKTVIGSRITGIILFGIASVIILMLCRKTYITSTAATFWFLTHPVVISFFIFGPNLYYSLMMFSTTLAFYGLLRERYGVFFLACILGLLSHLVFSWVVLSSLVLARNFKKTFAVATLSAIVASLPYVAYSIGGHPESEFYFSMPTLKMAFELAGKFEGGAFLAKKVFIRLYELYTDFFRPLFFLKYIGVDFDKVSDFLGIPFEEGVKLPITEIMGLPLLLSFLVVKQNIRLFAFIGIYFLLSLMNPVPFLPWQLVMLFIPTAIVVSTVKKKLSVVVFISIVFNLLCGAWFFSEARKVRSSFSYPAQKELAEYLERNGIYEPVNIAGSLGLEFFSNVRPKNYFIFGRKVPLNLILRANPGEIFIVHWKDLRAFLKEASNFGEPEVMASFRDAFFVLKTVSSPSAEELSLDEGVEKASISK